MIKRIVVITRDLSTYVGESYISDNTSPVVFRYDPNALCRTLMNLIK